MVTSEIAVPEMYAMSMMPDVCFLGIKLRNVIALGSRNTQRTSRAFSILQMRIKTIHGNITILQVET